ncbi:hypothetical protein KCV07_g4325, partial [Aureobasidium melanogenum]
MAPPTRRNLVALIALLIARIFIVSIIVASNGSANEDVPAREQDISMTLQQIVDLLEYEEGSILPLYHKVKKD